MKKTFSWFMALFTSVLLLVTGCSNASQVTFEDPTENKGFTADGLSAVTINANFGSSGRTILPNDWTEEAKGKLLYKLSGKSGSETVPDPTVFTYDEISRNKAVVPLAPVSGWSFTLEAYQVADVSTKTVDTSKDSKVLTATATADLSTGNQNVTFNLEDVITDVKARGNVDVTLKFYNKAKNITGVKFEVISGLSGDVTVAGVASPVSQGGDFLDDGKNTEITSGITGGPVTGWAKIVPAGNDWSSATLYGKLPVGEHTLKYTFYTLNNGAAGSSDLDYTRVGGGTERILITGGNTSKATIIRDEKSMNSNKPIAPSNFAYSVSFEPETAPSTVELSDGTKAQIIDDAKGTGVCDTYNLTFTWKDNSYDESMFKIRLSDKETTESAIIITPKTGELKTAVAVVEDPDKTTGTAYDSAISSITRVAGDLSVGSTSVTLSVPTTVKFQEAKIFAANEITEKTKIYDTSSTSDTITKESSEGKSIGMATISYGLKSKTPDAVAKINYTTKSDPNSVAFTDGKLNLYFVMGYDLGNGAITPINTSMYPYVSLDNGSNLVFKEWKINDTYIADGNATGLALGTNITGNTIVYPIWTVDATVALKFPSYSTYKDVNLLNGSSKDAPIVFDYQSEKAKAQAAVPSSDTKIEIKANELAGGPGPVSENFAFKVFKDSDNTEVFNGTTSVPLDQISVSGSTLTWKTDAPEFSGGVYRVEISFDYYPEGKGAGGEPHRNISGTVYVNLLK